MTKKPANKRLITAYYLLLVTIVGGFTIQTVILGGMSISNSTQLTQLQSEYYQLLQNKQQLEKTLAEELSLLSVTSYAEENGFIPIEQPLIITHDSDE